MRPLIKHFLPSDVLLMFQLMVAILFSSFFWMYYMLRISRYGRSVLIQYRYPVAELRRGGGREAASLHGRQFRSQMYFYNTNRGAHINLAPGGNIHCSTTAQTERRGGSKRGLPLNFAIYKKPPQNSIRRLWRPLATYY